MDADSLTREMIENEPAGPRLNRWVAELVMGAHIARRLVTTDDRGLYDLVIPGGEVRAEFARSRDPWDACPAYSQDIAAALEVAKKSEHNIELRRIRHRDGRWQWMAHLRFSATTGEANCDDLPLAICRAALLSKLGV
jgi:hypothetical protein